MQVLEQTMTVQEAIKSRHSIRKFIQETMPREELQEILKLVSLAPSAWNLQPWRFHVITDTVLKEKLQEAAYGQQQVTSAPAVIVVASDMEDVLANLMETVHPGLTEERKQEEVANLAALFGSMTVEERAQWALAQTNIALGFLLLTAEGFGYSTVPMLGFDPIKVKELLGLAEHVKLAAMVPIGKKAAEGYPHHRHDLNRIAKFH
ncbi:nitroreductase family protein [Ammoniphilus sp. YIM 78166]|uniref:nitroreductase family protein n=1 Tax=Ammoniphilus sp. YIM 78166 TaxID=1644106 RepID=UPI00107067F5|nr:nitroreductase family protein [Ammoniphilus sp. YIM 78166]